MLIKAPYKPSLTHYWKDMIFKDFKLKKNSFINMQNQFRISSPFVSHKELSFISTKL